jgi:hypothetical protein
MEEFAEDVDDDLDRYIIKKISFSKDDTIFGVVE